MDHEAAITQALDALEAAILAAPHGSLSYEVALRLFRRADNLVFGPLELLMCSAPDYPDEEEN